MIDMDAANAIESAIDAKIAKAASKETRTTGKVTRIDSDGTVFVMLQGSDIETPVKYAAAAVEPDEEVTVTISGGSMSIDGNYSRPATDDRTAKAAQQTADAAVQNAAIAADAAAAAVANAEIAEEAAISAQNSLKSVVQGATTVEKAVSVMQTALEAVIDYDPDNDEITEYFWHDANGAHVLGDTSGYRNDIDSTGMDIVEVSSEDSVAHLGAVTRLGKESGEGRLRLDYHSMQLIDMDDYAYLAAADGRGADGIADITQAVPSTSMGFVSVIKLKYPVAQDGTWSVTLDGNDDTANWTLDAINRDELTRSSIYVMQDSGTCEYQTNVPIWTLTFGTRGGDPTPGLSSTVLGVSNGESGPYSLASGVFVSAQGYAAHAEGEDTEAAGARSHAQNEGTRALSDAQTALGKYNVEDANDTYAAIIGNGTADNARSNALAVKWDGGIVVAGHSSEIGDVVENDISSNVSCAVSTYTNLGSIALASGVWVITGGVDYASGAAGARLVSISTNSSGAPSALELRKCTEYVSLNTTREVRITTQRIVSISANTTYYLKAWQNGVSGGLNAKGNICAVRIK